jgi:hypothetical protein
MDLKARVPRIVNLNARHVMRHDRHLQPEWIILYGEDFQLTAAKDVRLAAVPNTALEVPAYRAGS